MPTNDKYPKRCSACGYEWDSEYEPDIFDECPRCGSEDGVFRRVKRNVLGESDEENTD